MKRSGEFNKADVLKNYSDFDDYLSIERWCSYYYQIKEINELNPESILEVGPGNNFIRKFLSDKSINYKSVDVDSTTNPDIVSDIRNLSKITDQRFDLVVAFQVLEHLPYSYFR